MIRSWRASAGRIASGVCSHNCVLPSISVNRNVTVPLGRAACASEAGWAATTKSRRFCGGRDGSWIATGGAVWLSVGLAYALLVSVGGGLIAVWAAFLALAPAQAVIYRWRWHLAVREQCR
jgi:TM2 domain-containing membrane protein YozV